MSQVCNQFIELLKRIDSPRVFELGTHRTDPSKSTIRKSWVPHSKEYVGVDLFEGEDVDIVVDCHELTAKLERNYFDAFIACSTFEHLKYPWVVALELNKVLKVNGLGIITTHQTFPLHAYPHDYWRYTTEAFESLFNKHTGFKILTSDYSLPCVIKLLDDVESWSANGPSYLNVNVLIQKIDHLREDSFHWKRSATKEAELSDIAGLVATLNNDGIVHIPGPTGAGVFAMVAVNAGAPGIITASADTGGAYLPVTILICETDPATGQCLAEPSASVTTSIEANQSKTFSVFVTGSGAVPFKPATNRIFVRFKDHDGVRRGTTSVAVCTDADPSSP
jgi:SAM-dependent methyltransferase